MYIKNQLRVKKILLKIYITPCHVCYNEIHLIESSTCWIGSARKTLKILLAFVSRMLDKTKAKRIIEGKQECQTETPGSSMLRQTLSDYIKKLKSEQEELWLRQRRK